jgi:hypothetical protein
MDYAIVDPINLTASFSVNIPHLIVIESVTAIITNIITVIGLLFAACKVELLMVLAFNFCNKKESLVDQMSSISEALIL